MKNLFVKRILTVGFSLAVLAGSFTGCGSATSQTAAAPANADAQTTEESKPEEAAPAESGEKKKLTIGYVDSGASSPNEALSIVIEKGFLAEELEKIGYEFEAIPFTGAGPAINEAMVNGSIDAATTGDVPAINGKSKGINTTLLAGEVYFNDAALVVPADSDIQTVADLKGKTVATLQGSYMHKALINMLEDAGLTFEDINFSSMPSADAATAVLTGAVEAALVANTQEAVLIQSPDVKIIKTCEDNQDWKGGHAIIINSDYLAANRDAAVALVKAYKRANEYAKENYDDAITILSKSGGTVEDFKFYYPDKVDFNLSSGDTVIEAYTSIKDFLIANEILGDDFDIASWIDTSVWDDAVIE